MSNHNPEDWRFDLIHDSVVADEEPEVECGARAWEIPGADPCTVTWIPCQRNFGHSGQHYSTSGCAGGQVTWDRQFEPDQFTERQQFLVDLETVAVELTRMGQHGLAESLRDIARRNA